MGRLRTELNLADADGLYVELARLFDGLDREASAALSARLILLLCNHIGDAAVLREAFALSRGEPLAPLSPAEE